MHYNEDRQIDMEEETAVESIRSLGSQRDGSNDAMKSFVYLSTIGKYMICSLLVLNL